MLRWPGRRQIVRSLPVMLLAVCPALAQTYQDEPFGESAFPESTRPAPAIELPQLTFQLLTEIPLPGPLPGGSPRVVAENRVQIAVAGSLAVTAVEPGATPELMPWNGAPPHLQMEAPSAWVVSPNGRRRFRTLPQGLVIAHKCCSVFRDDWYRVWKLRVAGGTVAPPLVLDRRVFVGALDNQIYALKARNGHRLWSVDVGQRISNQLALWSGRAPVVSEKGKVHDDDVQLVLAVLDSGSTLLALDAASGVKVASFELAPADGRLVGAPAATPDGSVVVARQKYLESEAGLMVLKLAPLELPRPADADVASTASE